jgi:antitoxin VapB
MKTVEVIQIDGSQAIKLPEDFRFNQSTVSIRREGKAVILEPIGLVTWPPSFFEAIRIDDPAFHRPDQGQVPPAPTLS